MKYLQKFTYFLIIIVVLLVSSFCKKKDEKSQNLEGENKQAQNQSTESIYVITGNNVNVRKDANLKGKVLVQLNIDDEVIFISKSDSKEKIGDKEHYWFKVKTNDITGWIYGAYLKPKENSEKSNSPDSSSILEKVEYRKIAQDDIPASIMLTCEANAFKSKQELLGKPESQRYSCKEYLFSKQEVSFLKQKGFYIKQIPPLQYVQEDDMVDQYKAYSGVEKPTEVVELTEIDATPRYSLTPLFISADYVLHLYHLLFTRMLEDMETNKFYPLAKQLTDSLLKEAIQGYKTTSDKNLKEAYKRVAAFFAVPAMIMGSKVENPEISSLANKDLESVTKASGFGESSITGEKEDFTQYIPRGHYNKNDTLKNYFKVMMWYGRIYFPLEDPIPGMLITSLLSEKQNIKTWEDIYIPTSYLVGKSDDLDYYAYKSGMDRVFGVTYNPKTSPDKSKLATFVQYLKNFQSPRIISNSVRNDRGSLDLEEKQAGFRFMGQRFIPDSHIFTMLTSPRVGSDEQPRNFPKGLDVMSILGSNQAEKLLEDEFKTVPKLSANHNFLKKQFQGYDDKVYNQNIYWSWLNSIRSLFGKPAKGLPDFVYTPEWGYRLLLTSHGTWAELRHDTLLYAKQSYAEMGGPDPETIYYAGQPEIPKGYVEPNYVFFSEFGTLVYLTKDKIQKAGVLTDEYSQKLEKFQAIIVKLSKIAQKETTGSPITDEDYLFIANFSKELGAIILPFADYIEDQYKQMAIIADVHTDAFSQMALEVGVGSPQEMFVYVKDKNGSRVCVGYTYSYYEFKNSIDKRMTDEDWKKKVYEPSSKDYLQAKKPSWIKMIPTMN
ncbi:MAG: DUF3160 domain-containing protein [Leptospiraceae bacterium]|nr:DUF3160 domain-containing protein [Leptospiraceae bacterium]MCP5496347.1 DUF3160 domain-containing protein [Leptospiraceae bacterium]